MQWIWEKSELQEALENIPLAQKRPIRMRNVDTRGMVGIVFDGKLVGVVSKHYKLVQHKRAFMPICKGLDNVGIDYDFGLRIRPNGKAELDIIAGENVADTVRIGFRAINSIDGSSAIKYTFSSYKTTGYFELVGFREACKNGMVVQVPLEEAEFVKPVEKKKIEMLLNKNIRILHKGNTRQKIHAIQYVVEAISIFRNPVARMIESAQNKLLSEQEAWKLILKYVGKRLSQRIYNNFKYADDLSLWGLYNSITNIATHEVSNTTANGLYRNSAVLLREELVGEERA